MLDVKLEVYAGPLDLLLRLIQKNEIDIYDIPIAKLTDDYLKAIENLNMDDISEFLVMAATLLEIKSKMLLPRPKLENETFEDPREALAQQLLAYKQAQEIAEKISELTPLGDSLLGVGEKALFELLNEKNAADEPISGLVSMSKLMEIFESVIKKVENKIDKTRAGYGNMPREKFSVTEKAGNIMETLKQNGRLSLKYLFLNCISKHEMIVTFLAILELMRRGKVHAVQAENFGDVEVIKCRQAEIMKKN